MSDAFDWKSPEEKKIAYQRASALVANDVNDFWRMEASRLYWQTPFHTVHNGKFSDAQWFLGGKLNVSVNCLDRHVHEGRGKVTAITFENEQGEERSISYERLLEITCHISRILQERGVKAGDRVAIYLPMIPESVASMLACARIGAIHTVIFGGFSKEALAERIHDAKAIAIITAEHCQRKGKPLNLADVVSEALKDPRCESIKTILMIGAGAKKTDERYVAYDEQRDLPASIKQPPSFDAEHPLFILYTSGTTGKPKGIFHTTGGYLTQATSTTKWVFDLRSSDLYWCTADVGWITGHSYVAYGPLALGKRLFMYDGALTWPTPRRVYDLIEKHCVTVLYTAPTAIRMFMQAGEEHKGTATLKSLRLLGSVGEPINPEAWNWYHRVFGNGQCPIVDSWWQTETGAMMIVPVEHVSHQKPGSASTPFLGIKATVIDDHHRPSAPEETGYLVIEKPWPSMARGIWGDQKRFIDTYFSQVPGAYFTGDGAKIDEAGDFTISGRIDDVVNVSGHRLGTAEIESALVAHESVAEAAVVGIPDPLTGQRLCAFVVLMHDVEGNENLSEQLKDHVKKQIGSFARPSTITFQKGLPKTRSGKIMRRLLRSVAQGERITSDTSTLEDESPLLGLNH